MDSHAVERFSDLMDEIGKLENFGLVVGHDDQPLWQVIIEENDLPILLELDETRLIAVLSSEIGTPKPDQVDRINALALEYSHLYATTGGARISRSKDDGIYSLIADYGVASLTRASLGDILRRFKQLSGGWRDIIAGEPAHADHGFGLVTGEFILRV